MTRPSTIFSPAPAADAPSGLPLRLGLTPGQVYHRIQRGDLVGGRRHVSRHTAPGQFGIALAVYPGLTVVG